jgi:hypothetical protein
MARQELTGFSRIDPYRSKASGESTAALFRGNPDGTLLFTGFVTDRRRPRARSWFGRHGIGGSTETLEEIADKPSQTEILCCQILHLHDRWNVETAKTSPPAIESSQRHSSGIANFSDGHTGAGLMEQMKNFILSESGLSHRIALMQLLSWYCFNRRRRRSLSGSRCSRCYLSQSLAAQNTCVNAAANPAAAPLACLKPGGLICFPCASRRDLWHAATKFPLRPRIWYGDTSTAQVRPSCQ